MSGLRQCQTGALRNADLCGDWMINFQSASENKVVDVSKMKVGDSCSYRVMSKCGFPKVEINSTDIFMNMAYLD